MSALCDRRKKVVERLEAACSAYYDIEKVADAAGLEALLAYHERDSRYVLVRRAELWAAERHEYMYLWSVERLDEPKLAEIVERVLADGEPRVRPHAQHMCTCLTGLIVCETADAAALQTLRQTKKHRDYRFSLHGWLELRLAALEIADGSLTFNRAGRQMAKELRRLTADALREI